MTWLADVVLAVLALEAAVLLVWGKRWRLSRAATLTALAPGAALVLALRAALGGGGSAAIGGALVLAFVGHAADLARRWRGRPDPHRPSAMGATK